MERLPHEEANQKIQLSSLQKERDRAVISSQSVIHIYRKEFNLADRDLFERTRPDLKSHFHARAKSAKHENRPPGFSRPVLNTQHPGPHTILLSSGLVPK
jgi:hypothetical protein